MRIGGRLFHGTFDEDIGSTLLFDRASLKRMAEAEVREASDLTMQSTADEQPLACVTTKRLRLSTAAPARSDSK